MAEEREEPILPASCDWTLILREATMGEEREEPILLTSALWLDVDPGGGNDGGGEGGANLTSKL